ncbi:hypothetical protein VP01_459g5 [Puccinia sorghi]|uniref:Uncharacterized protein n=1 Tax=Puccinia sorghi TaxID=27349 RepID=A0A0L6UQI4_9BASI|nr:hypothetical protein VP01_459g5 [Puccinia sorghi]
MTLLDLWPRAPKSPQNDSYNDLHDDIPNDSSASSMVTDDNHSSLPSSDSASSPCPGLPRTPPRLDINPRSIRAEQTPSRDSQQFWPNLHDLQTSSCSAPSVNIASRLAHPPTDSALESCHPYVTNLDTTTVLLQPPIHVGLSTQALQSQPPPHTLPYKSSIPQIQLGAIPLSTQWISNQQRPNAPMPFGSVEHARCQANNFRPAPPFIREDMDEPEVDPFSQLSARTLALMDQPESEVTIYDCEYCDKTYQGKHARSIWRRHLSDKHKIPLSTQPRRTRWDNDVNRPKTEEERRERTLESKRRWARKNRAAKKAARDGQRNSMEHASSILYSKSFSQNHQRGTPIRSQAPSPIMYQSSLVHRAAGSPEYFAGTEVHGHSQPLQVHPSRSSMSILSRGTSAPQSFPHYLPMSSQPTFSMGDVPYNPSLHMSQSAQAGCYSFGNYTAPGDPPSAVQFSEHFIKEDHSTYSPQPSQTHLSNQSPPATYGTEVKPHDLLAQPHDLPDCFPSAPLNFQYSSWELGGRFNFGSPLPSTLEKAEPLSHESHSKRQRLSLSSSAPVPLQQFDDLQKAYGACNLDALNEAHDLHPGGSQEPCILSGEVAQSHLGSKRSSVVSARDDEAQSESSSVAEQRTTSFQNEQGDSYCMFDSSMESTQHHGGWLEGQTHIRPATAGTLPTLAHDQQHPRVAHLERAATEPQFSVRHDLQTPLRGSGLRSDGRFHLSHSPIYRMDAPGLDAVDLLSSPGVARADASAMSLYQGHYAPMSAGKRRSSDTHHVQPLSSSCPLNTGDWSNQALQTPSGFSRFPFSNSMLSSPAGGAGLFGSPHNLLSKSLGLTVSNNATVSGEESLGGLLAGSSTWDMVHQRT